MDLQFSNSTDREETPTYGNSVGNLATLYFNLNVTCTYIRKCHAVTVYTNATIKLYKYREEKQKNKVNMQFLKLCTFLFDGFHKD